MSECVLRINIVTHFPKIHESYFNCSFFEKLTKEGYLNIFVYSLFDYAKLINIKKIDDKPYGGGSGLLLRFDFIFKFLEAHNIEKDAFIHPSPSGFMLSNKVITTELTENTYTFLCTRYEGVDARAIKYYSMKEISIGDYILYDGDTSALVIINALVRHRFVKKSALISESISSGLLEYDQYTQPYSFNNMCVPEVLKNGNHESINKWKYDNSINKTKRVRPDLYENYFSPNNKT